MKNNNLKLKKHKNIAINALGLKSNTGGVESYIFNLVKSLLENDKENSYFLFVGDNTKTIFNELQKHNNLRVVSYPINTNNSTIRVIAENTLLAFDLIAKKIDLVHHTCNYMPKISPVKSTVTLHDMVAFFYNEKYPEYKVTQRFYNYFKKAMKFTAKKAVKIVSISEFTKREFLKKYKIDEDKVVVIGQSLDTRKKSFDPNLKTIEKFDIKKPYLLSVSVIRPHKNFDFLVRVFNKLKKEYNIPHQLIIAGGVHFGEELFLKEIEQSSFKSDIKYLGYVKDKDLSSLYTYAEAFVFPSLYEGFGIPLLEAIEYEIPVISSNQASLLEVGGNSVVFFDPYDEDNAKEIIFNTINNNSLQISKDQLNTYNWNKVAIDFINLFNEVA